MVLIYDSTEYPITRGWLLGHPLVIVDFYRLLSKTTLLPRTLHPEHHP